MHKMGKDEMGGGRGGTTHAMLETQAGLVSAVALADHLKLLTTLV